MKGLIMAGNEDVDPLAKYITRDEDLSPEDRALIERSRAHVERLDEEGPVQSEDHWKRMQLLEGTLEMSEEESAELHQRISRYPIRGQSMDEESEHGTGDTEDSR